MDKMTKEDYLKAHRNSGIEVGDTVRVLRKADRNEQGWYAGWVDMMDFCIGKEFNVLNDEGITGFKLSTSTSAGGGFSFPWFVLEIIKKKNQCPIDLDDLDFGCVDKELIKQYLLPFITEDKICGTYPKLNAYSPLFKQALLFIKEIESCGDEIKEIHFDSIIQTICRVYQYKNRQ